MVEVLLARSEEEMMDYFQWCERVLSAYLEAARSSLQVRRDGLRPDQVARRVFGPEVLEQDGFFSSSEWEKMSKFVSEGRPAREGASRKGARPCPQRVLGVVRNPHLSLRHKLHTSTCAGVLGSLVRGYKLCGRTSP